MQISGNGVRVNKAPMAKGKSDEILQKRAMGITITRICEDTGLCYATVKKVLDAQK
jgi:hypothetical protein